METTIRNLCHILTITWPFIDLIYNTKTKTHVYTKNDYKYIDIPFNGNDTTKSQIDMIICESIEIDMSFCVLESSLGYGENNVDHRKYCHAGDCNCDCDYTQ